MTVCLCACQLKDAYTHSSTHANICISFNWPHLWLPSFTVSHFIIPPTRPICLSSYSHPPWPLTHFSAAAGRPSPPPLCFLSAFSLIYIYIYIYICILLPLVFPPFVTLLIISLPYSLITMIALISSPMSNMVIMQMTNEAVDSNRQLIANC